MSLTTVRIAMWHPIWQYDVDDDVVDDMKNKIFTKKKEK